MNKVLRTFFLAGTIVAISLLFISCGKKVEEEYRQPTREISPVSDLDSYLEKQEVICEPGKYCPEYLTKIIVIDGNKKRFCTGFLTDLDTVATSTSCLTDHLRVENISCDREIFFFFPKTYNRPAQRMGCKKVLKVSTIDSDKPVLWRSNLAFLELDKSPRNSRSLIIKPRTGINNHQRYVLWAIDQVNETTGVVRKEECEAIHNSYFNPMAQNEASPNMLFSGCDFKSENRGAPIVDYWGKLKAVASAAVEPKIIDFVNSTGLASRPIDKKFFHASSMACAPTIYDTDVLDERECWKDLSPVLLYQARENLLSNSDRLKEELKKVQKFLEESNRFIRFVARFQAVGEDQVLEVYPECFKNVSQWIHTFPSSRNYHGFHVDIPFKAFKRAIDHYGRIFTVEDDRGKESFNLQFSPKTLKQFNYSTVFMWNDSVERSFPRLLSCSLL